MKETKRNKVGTNNGIISCSKIIDIPKIKTMDPHASQSPESFLLVTARMSSSANSIPKRVIVPDKHKVQSLDFQTTVWMQRTSMKLQKDKNHHPVLSSFPSLFHTQSTLRLSILVFV